MKTGQTIRKKVDRVAAADLNVDVTPLSREEFVRIIGKLTSDGRGNFGEWYDALVEGGYVRPTE